MYQTDLKYAKTWRLRRWLTSKNKALKGAHERPSGLYNLIVPEIENDIRQIKAELARRASTADASSEPQNRYACG